MMNPADIAKLDTLPLHSRTPVEWARAVLADPIRLLMDHAFLEKKAANNALELLTRWPGDWLPGWVETTWKYSAGSSSARRSSSQCSRAAP